MNHQESAFHSFGNFLNLALGQGLKKFTKLKKMNFVNHPYLCKSL
ncbi:hypothetical protein BROOK1789B_1061 [Bathymodiolus brooksi thiotrophic gill symbiont]|nr:hypothetical protein BROOK1789B_1061 [Bathymodiolus brooksi thiotrophic gill symbiont]